MNNNVEIHPDLGGFDINATIDKLKSYLPAQPPLKDFIYRNPLSSFVPQSYHEGLESASKIFGYKPYLSLIEYNKKYKKGEISDKIIDKIILRYYTKEELLECRRKLFSTINEEFPKPRIGRLRKFWHESYKFNLDKKTVSKLFKIISGYLDQGISIRKFPCIKKSFLETIREIELLSKYSILNSTRARNLLLDKETKIEDLLKILVGDDSLYEQYLFDQQFNHPGWSGMVSNLESNQSYLIESRPISLHDFIFLELLLEIDTLDFRFKGIWSPISDKKISRIDSLFNSDSNYEIYKYLKLWQESLEWTYYDQVLAAIRDQIKKTSDESISFHAVFCIDDRECSFRRYLEYINPNCKTYGTPGHFNIPIYYQPNESKFYTKICPAPITPRILVKEIHSKKRHNKNLHSSHHSHNIFTGLILTYILGLISALEMAVSIFFPRRTSYYVSSFDHMDPNGKLTINKQNTDKSDILEVGFTLDEMVYSLEGQLRSIGLIDNFSPIIYIIGHGSSSINNTHYTAYDCGACSSRPGSVNARIFASIANKEEVRIELLHRGIKIPDETQFIGGLHDTARDEIIFYDENVLNEENFKLHKTNLATFKKSLSLNAKERSRRFSLVNTSGLLKTIHAKMKQRSYSIFEPRQELTHQTNCLCIIGRRELSKNIHLDRRSFLNSYDPTIDPSGDMLKSIIEAVVPVCGGINLSYNFSMTDNNKIGAGSKLSHNVVGLLGVSNGMEGDLRTGLPLQMVDIHEPLRLLLIIEQDYNLINDVIRRNPSIYEWFKNEWILLSSVDPITREIKFFQNSEFIDYEPLEYDIPIIGNLEEFSEESDENFPVVYIS